MSAADPRATGLFLGAFLDELVRWGVREVVVSPGSRSTPLAVCAFELARREPGSLRVSVDVDERGAAFVALGMGKADGRPAAVVCTSGTAVANLYPAVMEAESSRVPLIVLTGDRPPRLQGLGAPQTCDQLNAYGAHVRAFRQMPLPGGDGPSVALARQAAREAVIAAAPFLAAQPEGPRVAGACLGGPVHLNFPFEEPLMPDLSGDPFSCGRRDAPLYGVARARAALDPGDAEHVAGLIASRRTLVLAGEGTCDTEEEARDVLAWARACGLPLLADPLSGLRGFDDACVIDNYDAVVAPGGGVGEGLAPRLIVRFGRYPVSKAATQMAHATGAAQVVVDPWQTRDMNAATDVLVPARPRDFACASLAAGAGASDDQRAFLQAWCDANRAARQRIAAVEGRRSGFEGAFVFRLLRLLPAGSCLFCANSMAIRAVDTFCVRADKPVAVLCNRGLNGIDGTLSTAVGVALRRGLVTLLVGDLALLHDLNALALGRELGDATLVVVLLNNDGGGIFDTLPQRSEEPYFERLFLTPQGVDFSAAAAAFGVPHRRVEDVAAFEEAYVQALEGPGIKLIEVPVPLRGVKERYAPYGSQA